MAMASSAIEIRSPAVSSMSNSRPAGTGTICLARSMSSSVVSPIAETTTTTSWPAFLVPTMRSATRLIRSASATDEPPYFCTTRLTKLPFDCWRRVQDTGRPKPDPPRAQPRLATLTPPARLAEPFRRAGKVKVASGTESGRGGEGGVQDVEALAEQVVADHQRRQEAQHVAERPRGQRDQPLGMAGLRHGGGAPPASGPLVGVG